MFGYIYKITNRIKGKVYIGQRKYCGNDYRDNAYFGSGVYLKQAIKKHGKENFYKEIIEEVETKETLDERETFWINHYHSYKKDIGYNLTNSSSPYSWANVSDEQRLNLWKQRISDSHHDVSGENNPMFGKTHSESARERIRISKLGKPISEETKVKLSKAFTGENNPRYGKIGWNKGRTTPLEVREKISKATTGKKRTEEQRKRISEVKKGHKMHSNTKTAIIKANQERHKNMTEEEKRAFCEMVGKNSKKAWDSLTPEQRKERAKKCGRKISVVAKVEGKEFQFANIKEAIEFLGFEWKRKYHENIKKASENNLEYEGYVWSKS